ncbi:hypothetical protein P3709_05270 [Vibrio parahaemolyticus]|uniref:hypothetical protein n=1 Tax=Vibrio parahaemolyticus TaxID=670 RepID=UPI00215C57C2|nr:hypothetical protein [Vibrio parahaemolyticus]MCR9793490.1 hypothetical protein [Vibrio parahaemolyticus]MCR9828115.1 hypothetical protein [Vibrio parahaemolyticus]MDF5432025.1 hypothetical protein [Vibrio parahaemolyticus]MDF5437695.1 hypothetical protein [Vibrio parahaemolyticus]MDF5566893.1 hypothetical protein [Vibrio parahaemolyticus]
MIMTPWEEVDINNKPEIAETNELSFSDFNERLTAMLGLLPLIERFKLEPEVSNVLRRIERADLERAYFNQKSDVYFINSILISFEAYLDTLFNMEKLDNEWASKYRNDVEKLNELANRLEYGGVV